MQSARVTRGFEHGKHFGSEATALVEFLKLMPCGDELPRQLEHSRQPQHT